MIRYLYIGQSVVKNKLKGAMEVDHGAMRDDSRSCLGINNLHIYT